MAKKTLTELGLRFKKVAVASKQYTDDQVNENVVKLFVKGTANAGFLKTYILAKGADTTLSGGDVAAAKKIGEIDIPRDFLVKAAKLLEVEAGTGANQGKWMVTKENGTTVTAYEAPAGVTGAGQWIDLQVNTIGSGEADAQPTHVCIDVTSLLSACTSGNAAIGINGSQVSLVLGSTPNGLTVAANDGLVLNLATTSAAGAQSAAGKQLEQNILSDLALMTNAEIGSWYGYNATESEQILGNVSSDSITDE